MFLCSIEQTIHKLLAQNRLALIGPWVRFPTLGSQLINDFYSQTVFQSFILLSLDIHPLASVQSANIQSNIPPNHAVKYGRALSLEF